MFIHSGFAIISELEVKPGEGRLLSEDEIFSKEKKVGDRYLIHYDCGFRSREKESIENYYCEKCKKYLRGGFSHE